MTFKFEDLKERGDRRLNTDCFGRASLAMTWCVAIASAPGKAYRNDGSLFCQGTIVKLFED